MRETNQAHELLHHALPARARATFGRELVRRHIEDLNALGDRLAYLAERGALAEEVIELRARCDLVIEALGWNVAEVVEFTWEWLESPPRYAEDVFAPALMLKRLDSDAVRVAAWRASLSEASNDVLARLLWSRAEAVGRP